MHTGGWTIYTHLIRRCIDRFDCQIWYLTTIICAILPCVQLYIGDSYSYSVGAVLYVDSYCNDPSNNCPALIGGVVGGGIILIIIIIVIAVVCFCHPAPTYIVVDDKNTLVEKIEQDNTREKVKRCIVPHNRILIQREIGRGVYKNHAYICARLVSSTFKTCSLVSIFFDYSPTMRYNIDVRNGYLIDKWHFPLTERGLYA